MPTLVLLINRAVFNFAISTQFSVSTFFNAIKTPFCMICMHCNYHNECSIVMEFEKKKFFGYASYYLAKQFHCCVSFCVATTQLNKSCVNKMEIRYYCLTYFLGPDHVQVNCRPKWIVKQTLFHYRLTQPWQKKLGLLCQ